MVPPAPSDSAGGSTHAVGDDVGASDGPANTFAHAHQQAHFPAPGGTAGGFTAQPAHSHGGGCIGGGGGGGGVMTTHTQQTQQHATTQPFLPAAPAHSMQNSVFTARRWDRATGSTSTVGASRARNRVPETREDSAGDSCGGDFSNNTGDGPVDSTEAQRFDCDRRGDGHGDARDVKNEIGYASEDDGEEVEGGAARAATSGFGTVRDTYQGPPEVDSAPPNSFMGIGDGFAETSPGGFRVGGFGGGGGSVPATAGGFAVGGDGPPGASARRGGSSRGSAGKRRAGASHKPSLVTPAAGGGGTGESGDATDPGDAYAPPLPHSGRFAISGPAFSAPATNPPPVPLFHSAHQTPREINSPVPAGTAAAARALAIAEAEGECEAHRFAGLGGMDIGLGDEFDFPNHDEHGYAPAYSEENSGELGGVSGGVSGGGGGAGGGDHTCGVETRPSGRPPGDRPPHRQTDVRRVRAESGSAGGHVPPNHTARPAVSGATPSQNLSGRRGGVSAGPADGALDIAGGGGRSVGNAEMTQHGRPTFSASVGGGGFSMHKNGNGGQQQAVAMLGNSDESEEDGEEIGSRPGGGGGGFQHGDADMENDDE